MKNNQIIESWSKIEPSDAANERMLHAILHSKQKTSSFKKTTRIRLAPIAASLAIIMAMTALFGSNLGWFGNHAYDVQLYGNTLQFRKSDSDVVNAESINYGFETIDRELNLEENASLFGDLDIKSYGSFNPNDKTLIRVEGTVEHSTVILTASWLPTADWDIDGREYISVVNGTQITAGYIVTSSNSQGNKNIIFYASFTLNDVSVYVETGGNIEKDEALLQEIAHVIDTLIQNESLNLASITES